jgi:hypothetical protein
MGIRKRSKDPLLGFGWAGYTCATLLLAIILAIIAGIDLRYELMRLIQAMLGDAAMMLFVVRLPFALFGICSPTTSIVTGVAILLTFKIAPYRFNLFVQYGVFLLCTGWFLIAVTYFRIVDRAVFGPSQNGLFSMSGYYLLEITGAVIVGLIMVFLTRSRIVALAWLLASAAAVTEAVWITNSGALGYPNSTVLFTIFDIGQYTWFSLAFDVLTMGALLLWAILEHRKIDPDQMCLSCGYDLAGLTSDAACPECGLKQAAVVIPPNERPVQASG